MIEGNQDLTSLVAKVIGLELVEKLNKDPKMNHQGWKILARWSVSQPQSLAELLKVQGWGGLYNRLFNQLDLEIQAIHDNPDSSLSSMEKIQQAEIKMGL